MRRARVVPSLLTLALALYGTQAVGQAPNDAFAFDDTPLSDLLVYPPWFKKSFLDLQDDLAEA
ncbi:MAG: thioredoxin, partial [Pseudomonadota bacterium]